jgi:quinol monooxygenase YgiN
MAVRLIITFPLLPGKARAYAEAFSKVGEETRKEPGCEQYELFASTSNPDKVVLLERWTSQALLDKHMEVMKKRDMAAIGAMRAGPPVAEKFEV